MSKKIAIEEVRKYFKNLDCNLISKEYKNFKSNLEFICNKHKDKGVQLNSYRNARRGLCCHYCGKENSINSRKISEKELEKITENAGFIFVGTELINHKRKIIYKCKKHIDKGEQNAEVANMRKSNGNCPYCLNRCRTTESFKQEMKVINPNIEIIGEYINVHTKIKCKCNIDGYEWDALPHNLINGEGCRKCFVKRNSLNNTHTQEWFNSIMNILHPDIEVLSPFVKMQEKVKCKCNIDGYEWSTTPDLLINRSTGCYKCSCRKTGERCRKTNSNFLLQLKNVNPNIIPLENYIDDHTKIKCLCTIHEHVWYVVPNKILHRKTGCPKCASYHNENKLDTILDKWGYNYELQKKFPDCIDKKPLPFDRYLPDFNILIEYDGEQHYFPIRFGDISNEQAKEKFDKVCLHDNIKNKYCKDNNIPLIRIPYWERNDMEYYLFEKLVEYNAIELVA